MLDQTLGSHFHELYRVHRLFNRSCAQARNHQYALLHLRGYLGREPMLADLTDENIAGMMKWIVDLPRAARTANKSRDCILAQWRFYARKGIVKQWPDVGALSEPEQIPCAWKKAELNTLFRACEKQTGWIGGVEANAWWHALHALAWDTGERITPILRLKWESVDLRARVVTFRAEDRKGGRKANQKPIHRETAALLKQIRGDGELVLPMHFCVGTLYNHYDRLLSAAGLTHGRDSKFHKMRKSSASWFEAAGGNATDFLGHSSRRVTLLYLDPQITQKRRPCDKLFRPR